MMPGSKGHAFHVHMEKHDTETQKHRKEAIFHGKMCGFEVFQDFVSTKCGEIRGIMEASLILHGAT